MYTVTMILRNALVVTFITVAPILVIGLVVGLAVSIFQAVTSIQEMTLTYIPKIVVSFIVLLVGGPWMIQMVVTFAKNLIRSIPDLIR